jgi:autotransporter-associated beta strand protein
LFSTGAIRSGSTRSLLTLFSIGLLTVGCAQLASAQLVSFPGAIGFGDVATGGRGGSVYVVTNLNSSGTGSFEAAVSEPNRIVVFDVGGYINLDGEVAVANDVTIEGQTAPGQGIGLMDGEISFSSASNDIVNDIRVRQGNGSGTDSGKAGVEMDGGTNIILNHVSVQFGEFDSLDLTNSTDVTVQNSIISDAIGQQFGIHGQSDTGMTYAYNIFANDHNRNPDVENDGSAQVIDNIVYNVQAGMTSGNTGGTRMEDVVNNYFITGPSTTSNGDAGFYQVDSGDEMYASGNMEDDNKNGVLDGSSVSPGGATIESSPWFASTTTMPVFSAAGAFTYDTTYAGDSVSRDQLDSLDISQVESLGTTGGTSASGDHLYGSPGDSGLGNGGYGTITGGTAPTSSANDGIPDTWAETHGVLAWAAANSTTISNAGFATVTDPIGYDEVEDYANQLANQFPAITWTSASGNWSTTGNWSSSAAPGLFQQAFIRGNGITNGAVTITTSGNTAEYLSIGGNGPAAGEQLTITAGSLNIEDTILVGDQNNGSLNISGGTITASNVELGDTVYNATGTSSTTYTGTLNLTGGILALQQLVLGAGTPGAWNTGGAWNWSGGTLQATAALKVNVPATIGVGGAFVNTNGFAGTISSILSGIGGFTKNGAGTLIQSAANQYSGITTVNVGGVLDVTGSLLNNSSAFVDIAADSTGATKLIRSTPLNQSYDNFGSSITSDLFSTTNILSGYSKTNNPSVGKTISMSWSGRTASEQPDIISDIFTLTGMANSGTTGTGQTDPFALEMNFSTSEFAVTGPASETGAAAAGALELDWLDPNGGGSGISAWVNATIGDFGVGLSGDIFTDVQSSWTTFATLHGITDSNLGNYLGSWGVDTTDNQVWAVLNYNSTSFASNFGIASVPEPCSMAALVALLLVLALRRMRPRLATVR